MMPFAYKRKEKYNYADYLGWNDEERWELVEGVAYNMTPAPAPEHQEILTELVFKLRSFLHERKCRVYAAPFDVRFSEKENASDAEVDTVLQPDVSVVCDEGKIDRRGCTGAPDFVAEILSPYTSDRDMRDKFFIYEKYGVREYWIVDPANKTIHQYTLTDDGKYAPLRLYFKEDVIESSALPGLIMTAGELFPS